MPSGTDSVPIHHRDDSSTCFHDEYNDNHPDLELDMMSLSSTAFQEERMTQGWWCLKNHHRSLLLRILPSMLVSQAFWLSMMTLGVCDLAKVTLVNNNATLEPITFGLWSFSNPDAVVTNGSGLPSPMDRVATCIYHVGEGQGNNDNEEVPSSSVLFLDPKFRTARAFSVIAVCIGFLTMSAIWIGAIRDNELFILQWRKWVGISLLSCCFFEGMTLLVLRSGVCDSVNDTYGDCQIAQGSHIVFWACSFWFLTGVVMLKWPRTTGIQHSRIAHHEDQESVDQNVTSDQDDSTFWPDFWQSLQEEESPGKGSSMAGTEITDNDMSAPNIDIFSDVSLDELSEHHVQLRDIIDSLQ